MTRQAEKSWAYTNQRTINAYIEAKIGTGEWKRKELSNGLKMNSISIAAIEKTRIIPYLKRKMTAILDKMGTTDDIEEKLKYSEIAKNLSVISKNETDGFINIMKLSNDIIRMERGLSAKELIDSDAKKALGIVDKSINLTEYSDISDISAARKRAGIDG